MFDRLYFVFTGSTKKIAYADHLEGERIIPVQALTAIILCLSGVIGIYLFLKGYYRTAFLGGIAVTQAWRFLSEFVRADHRGGGKISAYQVMGILTILYAIGIAWLFPAGNAAGHDLVRGLKTLWNPALILSLQALWVIIFLYTGRSRVTGATLSFNVIREHI